MSTIVEYHAKGPASFGPIVSLAFSQADDGVGEIEQRLEICLSRRPYLGDERLRILFRGVRGLRFVQTELSLAALGTIEIRERAGGYAVIEEEGNLKFECQSFEIL